jgi:hypothetical protein
MTTLTLLVKASNPKQIKQVEDLLKNDLGDLDLEINVLGNPISKWLQVSVSGEDEAIATNYINQRIGTCPTNIKKYSNLKGYISKIDTAKQEVSVDVGVFEPKIMQAAVPLGYLQSHFAGGRKADLKKIAEIYSFGEGMPLSVKIVSLNNEDNTLQAELSFESLGRIGSWQRSLLDRLIVLQASRGEVEVVLKRTGLNRDVIGVEALGMFEHSLTCKLGTDAAGLVSRVGRYMRNSVLIVYSPKNILGLIGDMALNL